MGRIDMEATDLMIGDLVCLKDDTKYELPLKVDGIIEDDISLEGDGFLGGIDGLIRPIPLTPEILKKNGFEMFKYDGWIHYYRIFGNSVIPFVLHSTIGGEMLSQEVDIFSTSTNTNCGIDVNYVHEIQHALRLCGLNKIADNFKV